MNHESNATGAHGGLREFIACGFINLLVAERTPTVYVDEPPYADPAANLYFGNGFTSTMWGQDRHAFWAGNVPLYQGLLYCAFKLAGFGLFEARAVNTFLVAGAGFLIWLTLYRTRLIAGPGYRLLGLALVLSGAVSTLTFRTIRPDATMFAVCALVFSSFFIRGAAARYCALFLSSALLPAAGLAMLPYSTLVIALSLCAFGFRHLRAAAAIVSGLLAGIGGLTLLYSHFSNIRDFVGIIAPFTIIGGPGTSLKDRLLEKILGEKIPNSDNILTCFFGNPLQVVQQKTLFDYGAALLFLLVIVIFARQRRNLDDNGRRFFFFILAVSLLVPPMQHFLAHYRSMYRWMTYMPLCIAAPWFMEIVARYETIQFRRAGTAVVAVAIFLGVPLRTVSLASNWSSRSTGPINAIAARLIRPADVVICNWKVYFAIRAQAKLVFATSLVSRGDFNMVVDLPAADRVSLLCLQPQEFEYVTRKIGGFWSRIPPDLIEGSEQLSRTRYDVDFYRKNPEQVAQ